MALRGFRARARTLLLLGGFVAVGFVVHAIGPARILATTASAAPLLPWLVLLEFAATTADAAGSRALLGARAAAVPAAVFVRSSLAAYAVGVLAPAGRAAGEITRAAHLAPFVGGQRAAVAAARHQAAALLAVGTTLLGALAVAWRAPLSAPDAPPTSLTAGLAGSAAVTLALGSALAWGAHWPRFWHALSRVLPSLGADEARGAADVAPLWVGFVWCLVARLAQLAFFALAAAAPPEPIVRGVLRGAIAQGIVLVGATAGDAVPQQAGVLEGAFYLFAADLGTTAEQAVAVVILARIAQLVAAGLALVAQGVRRREARAA